MRRKDSASTSPMFDSVRLSSNVSRSFATTEVNLPDTYVSRLPFRFKILEEMLVAVQVRQRPPSAVARARLARPWRGPQFAQTVSSAPSSCNHDQIQSFQGQRSPGTRGGELALAIKPL